MKYQHWRTGFLTAPVEPGGGQCRAGGLTGAVASQTVTEAREGPLTLVGNQGASVKAQGGLTARRTRRAGAKAGLNDLAVPSGRAVT